MRGRLEQRSRMSRRAFLKGAGATLGATMVLVAGGGVWRARKQDVLGAGEGAAFEPWEDWRSEEQEGPMALVGAAILAANAHNAQPWLFKVAESRGGSRIDLFADAEREIGAVDPFSREMHIGLGCALENLLLAARARDYDYHLALVPDSDDPDHAASVDLWPADDAGEKLLSLYEVIPERHTNRYPYDTSRPVSPETLCALESLNESDEDLPQVEVLWFTTEEERRRVGGLVVEAAKDINVDKEQSYDNSERWLRGDRDAIERHRDGLTLDTMGMSGSALLAAKLLPKPSRESAGEFWIQSIQRQAATAAAFGIFVVHDYQDTAQRLAAGRLWQRMHLWMTNEGLAAQPMNQLHERADRELQLGLEPRFTEALDGLVGDDSRRGIFTFRLGHSTEQAPASPRRAVAEVRV